MVQSIALASTIPFLVASGADARRPRRACGDDRRAGGARCAFELVAVVVSLRWFSTGQWLTGRPCRVEAPGFAGSAEGRGPREFMMASSGLALVLVAVAGTLGFPQAAAWRRLGACLWCASSPHGGGTPHAPQFFTGGVTGLAYGILSCGAAILLSGLTQRWPAPSPRRRLHRA